MSENPQTSLLEKWRLLQAIMADPDLSPTAKNIAVRLLDHLNGRTGQCSPSYETLARGIGLARRRAISAVQELETAGWIKVSRTSREQARGAERGLPSNRFAFDWQRLSGADPSAESDTTLVPNPTLASAENDTTPSAENDTPLVSDSALPLVSDPTPKHMNLKPVIETGKKKHYRASKRDPETAPDFAAWWPAFPKKVDKKRAAELYRKIVDAGDATPDELMLGAQRYAQQRAGEDPQFTKHPKTWLNGRCWLDEPTSASSGAYRPTGTSRLTAAEAMLLAGGFGDDR